MLQTWPALALAALSLIVAVSAFVLSLHTYRRAGAKVRLETSPYPVGKMGGHGFTYIPDVRIINDGLSDVQVLYIEWSGHTGSHDAAIYRHGTEDVVTTPITLAKLATLHLSVLHPNLKPYTAGLLDTLADKIAPLPPRFDGVHIRAQLVVTLGTGKRLRSRRFRILTQWEDPVLGDPRPAGQPEPLPWLPSTHPTVIRWRAAQNEEYVQWIEQQWLELSEGLDQIERSWAQRLGALPEQVGSSIKALRQLNDDRLEARNAGELQELDERFKDTLAELHCTVRELAEPAVVTSQDQRLVR